MRTNDEKKKISGGITALLPARSREVHGRIKTGGRGEI
jgi:hypothetical protein